MTNHVIYVYIHTYYVYVATIIVQLAARAQKPRRFRAPGEIQGGRSAVPGARGSFASRICFDVL